MKLTSTLIGSNSHGFANETTLVAYMHGKTIGELNDNIAFFIKFILIDNSLHYSDDTVVRAYIETASSFKSDLYIEVLGLRVGVSVKMGSGNSVHQQRIEDFVAYLVDNYEVSQEVLDDFRLYIWCDGTLTGDSPKVIENGKVVGRFGARSFKDLYPMKRMNLLTFVNANKRQLLEYFLFKGARDDTVRYVYYGSVDEGMWASSEQILDYCLDNAENTKATLPIGAATIQSWNPGLNGSLASDKKRGQLQVKYGQLKKDLIGIMKLNRG